MPRAAAGKRRTKQGGPECLGLRGADIHARHFGRRTFIVSDKRSLQCPSRYRARRSAHPPRVPSAARRRTRSSRAARRRRGAFSIRPYSLIIGSGWSRNPTHDRRSINGRLRSRPPLQRQMNARRRPTSLPPCYTTHWDMIWGALDELLLAPIHEVFTLIGRRKRATGECFPPAGYVPAAPRVSRLDRSGHEQPSRKGACRRSERL